VPFINSQATAPKKSNTTKVCACAAPLRPLASYFQSSSFRLSSPKLLPAKHSDTTSRIVTTGKPLVVHDYEAANDWAAAIARHVDLEGIVTEGYGYTVTISGPPPKRKGKMRFPIFYSRQKDTSMTDSAGSKSTSKSIPKSRTSKELPIKTTDITITETYQTSSTREGRNFWKSLEDTSAHIRPENMEFITDFNPTNDDCNPPKITPRIRNRNSTHDDSHLDDWQTAWRDSVSDDEQDPKESQDFKSHQTKAHSSYDFQAVDEEIEALPQIPSPTLDRDRMSPTAPFQKKASLW